jgi:hypothetical protein
MSYLCHSLSKQERSIEEPGMVANSKQYKQNSKIWVSLYFSYKILVFHSTAFLLYLHQSLIFYIFMYWYSTFLYDIKAIFRMFSHGTYISRMLCNGMILFNYQTYLFLL